MAPSRNPSNSARTIAGRFASDGAAAARPVVVVHGLGLSSRYMDRFSRALVGVGPVYAVDLPGFGRSFRPEQPLDVPGLADALVAWMRGADIGPAVLVGNSLGAQVVLDVAVRYPELAHRLVLIAPTVDVRARTFRRQMVRVLLTSFLEPPGLIGLAWAAFARCGARTIWRTVRSTLEDPVERKLPLVRVPTLVVHGQRDRLVPLRWSSEVTRLLPRGRLRVVRGGHAPQYSNPVAVAGFVRELVEEPL